MFKMLLKVSRAWVATSNILRMSLPVEPPKSLKALKTGPLKNRLSKAINMAEQAKKMRKEDRLEKYSFATLFKGKWGIHPDSDTDEDQDEVPGGNYRKLGKKREAKVIPEPRKEILLHKKKKRTKTTPKIIRPDIFSDDDEDASTIVSPYKLQPKRNGISQSENGSSESEEENEAESDSSSQEQDGGHSEHEKEESDEKDSTVDEAKLEEALNYPMPEMYELHSEKAKKGKRAGLPLPRKIKVEL